MTIQEAIKSGKAFKRPKWNDYLMVKPDVIEEEASDHNFHWAKGVGFESQIYFHSFDLLADDWEVKE